MHNSTQDKINLLENDHHQALKYITIHIEIHMLRRNRHFPQITTRSDHRALQLVYPPPEASKPTLSPTLPFRLNASLKATLCPSFSVSTSTPSQSNSSASGSAAVLTKAPRFLTRRPGMPGALVLSVWLFRTPVLHQKAVLEETEHAIATVDREQNLHWKNIWKIVWDLLFLILESRKLLTH